MRTKVFNCPGLPLRVFRSADGSLAWQGTYQGTAIKAAIPVGGDCVILLDPDASKQHVFKNLLRVGCDGRPRWFAELPGSPDVFVAMHRDDDGLTAQTWSGFSVRIDLESGSVVAQEFVK